MAMKNTAEVVIAGRVYKISGYESPEYLHQIAVYLNDKMSELQKTDSYRKQNTDQKQLLLNMNLADDFFKSRRQAEKLSADLEKKERELYSVRHDLIEAQLALENQKKELKDLKKQGVWVFGTAAGGTTSLYDADLKGPAAIVIGSEGDGMTRLAMETCDFLVSIPMRGKLNSLNASAAAAILLYEAVRQRG